MSLPLWYKIASIILLILLLPALLLIALTLVGIIGGDLTILTIGILPSFVGILYEIIIVLTALYKRSWKFFLLAQGIFLIAWLVSWVLLDGSYKFLGASLMFVLSLLPIIFAKKILRGSGPILGG